MGEAVKGVGVAPITGAWIETLTKNPSRWRATQVAPITGAWIETLTAAQYEQIKARRAHHGRVD